MAEKQFNYTKKSVELADVLERMQNPAIEIDEATKLYDLGLKLVAEIEAYLQQAENTVRKHAAGE